jgi:hypothetical protein
MEANEALAILDSQTRRNEMHWQESSRTEQESSKIVHQGRPFFFSLPAIGLSPIFGTRANACRGWELEFSEQYIAAHFHCFLPFQTLFLAIPAPVSAAADRGPPFGE